MKLILIIFTIMFLASCSALIYKIRGPKYEGKFIKASYPVNLDSNIYYYRKYKNMNDSLTFNYIKFNPNGIYQTYSTDDSLSNCELQNTNVYFKNYYVFKNGFLKWEIYHNSYDGYNLFKAKVYDDSIVCWRVPYKRMKTVYIKLK